MSERQQCSVGNKKGAYGNTAGLAPCGSKRTESWRDGIEGTKGTDPKDLPVGRIRIVAKTILWTKSAPVTWDR